jgi:hypothetical protein
MIMIAMLGLCVTSGAQAAMLNVKDFGAAGDGRSDDEAAIQKAIDAAIAQGAGNEVYLPAGRYVLGGRSAGPSLLNIQKANGLTVEGEAGTVLVSAEPTKNVFGISDSANVTIRGMTIMHDAPVFSGVSITAIDRLSNKVTVSVEPGYAGLDSKLIKSADLLLVENDPTANAWGDHEADCAWYKPSDASVCWPPKITGRTQVSANVWELTLNTSPIPSDLGKKAYVWGSGFNTRGFLVKRTNGLLVEDVAYYPGGTGGAFILNNNTGDFTFRRFTMDVPPNSGQLIASVGGSMIFNNHITLTLDHVTIAHSWDDAINMGANFVRVYAQPAPNILKVDGVRSADFRPGDTLALWNWQTKQEQMRAKIVSVKRDATAKPPESLVMIDQEVVVQHTGYAPDKSTANDADGIDRVVDMDSAGSLHVINSTFQSLHARDILVKASHTVIEGSNFYDTVMAGILIGPEFFWDEGPVVTDVRIENNNFRNVSGTNILVDAGPSMAFRYNSNIVVKGNHFIEFGRYRHGVMGNPDMPIVMQNVTGGEVSDNVMSSYTPAAVGPVDTRNSTNVTTANNILVLKRMAN